MHRWPKPQSDFWEWLVERCCWPAPPFRHLALSQATFSDRRELFSHSGRDRFLPTWFAHIHPRFHTPDVAIITYAVIAFVLSFSSTFQKLAILANVVTLLLYLLCCLAALELTRRDVRTDGAPFTFPGANLIPILAIGVIIWILTHATAKEFAVTAACLGIASLLFFVRQLMVTRAKSV